MEVFEEYCNAGLYIIENWLDDNPGDPAGVDTLLYQIYTKMDENESDEEPNNDDIELDL